MSGLIKTARQYQIMLTKGIPKNIKFIYDKSFNKKRYEKLRTMKDTKNGRCFIVATGPSLTLEDLNKLKNEVTFGMNALIKWFPKMGWETTYYGIQDWNTYKKLESDILKLDTTKIFYSLEGQGGWFKFKDIEIRKMKTATEYPLYYGNHLYKPHDWNTKFSSQPDVVVYDGYTIAYSLLQIAVYMGYKEIYLIGTDCNYNTEKKNIVDIGIKNSNTPILGDRMIYAYMIAKKYADEHDIKIYNATRGGMLEVFPRVNLDKIL